MTRKVVHLIDDTAPGGVMQMLRHMAEGPAIGRDHSHEIRRIRRGALVAPRLEADVIVSHLTVTWMNVPLLTGLRALNPDVPMVHVEHSYTESFVAMHAVPRQRFATLMRVSYAMFDRIVAVSAPQAAWIRRRGFAPAERLVTINPSVDLSPFLALAPRLEGAPKVWCLIGRLDAQKGFDVAIRAFRAAAGDDESLMIFGEGPERDRLEALAEGDARIRFVGWADSPAEAVAACDAVLMPSRREAFGLVALEAQAAGRLLVVSGVDGLAEHQRHGAIAVGANSVDAWAETLRRLRHGGEAERILQGRQRARRAARAFQAAWLELLDDLAAPVGFANAA
ncbi:MAG: glycosyltransferase family 4 protein [Pseudomonadota bacterium]